jgi:DNA-binding transcriptional LysR family regulator
MPREMVDGFLTVHMLEPPAAPASPNVDVLLATTFDQLRTFGAVCRTGNVRAAARALGRDHSSVKKQLDTIDERFHQAAHGRLIVHASSRGGAVHVTEAGHRVQAFAESALRALSDMWNELYKARLDRPLRFAVSGFGSYVAEFLADTHPRLIREFERHGVHYGREIVPIGAGTVQRALLERDDLDFAFAGAMCRKNATASFDEALEFTEWLRDDLVVLANIDPGGAALSSRRILEQRVPMIAPRQGMIYEVLVADLDAKERSQLNVVEWCDDWLVAINLLQYRLCRAAVLCTRTFARFAKSRVGSAHLHIVPYQCEWDNRFGLLARRTDIEAWSENHPARLLWQFIRRVTSERKRQRVASAAVGTRSARHQGGRRSAMS